MLFSYKESKAKEFEKKIVYNRYKGVTKKLNDLIWEIMAKIKLEMFHDTEDQERLNPFGYSSGKNLKPPFGIVTASQPVELVDKNGIAIKRSKSVGIKIQKSNLNSRCLYGSNWICYCNSFINYNSKLF